MGSQAGTSLHESLRHPEVLESINHENSLTSERPILSQLRTETLDNLHALHELPDLHNVNLAPTDLQIPVSIFAGVCNFWGHICFYENFDHLFLLSCYSD